MFNKNPLTTKTTVVVLSVAILSFLSFVLFFRIQPPPTVKPVWKFGTNAYYNADKELPVGRIEISNKHLYFLNNEYLYALDKTSGKKQWQKKINNTVETLSLREDIYLTTSLDAQSGTSYDFTHMSIEPKTGKEKWRQINKKRVMNELLIGERLVFINDNNKTIFAYDKQTKRLMWSVKSSNNINEMILDKTEIVYVTDRQLVMLSASTGKKKWQLNLSPSVPSVGSKTVQIADDYVYLAEPGNSKNDRVYSLDRYTGKKIWQYDVRGYVGIDIKVVANNVYFTSSYDTPTSQESIAETFYVLNKKTGKDIWQIESTEFDKLDPVYPDEPGIDSIINGQTMFYATDEVKNNDKNNHDKSTGIKRVDLATGKQKWEFELELNEDEWIHISSLYYEQDKIVFKTEILDEDNIEVYCLDANTGRQLWNYVDSSIRLVNVLEKHAFFVKSSPKSEKLTLMAIDLETGRTKWKLPIKSSRPEKISSLKVFDNKVYFITESAVENDPEFSTVYSVKL